ncbi:hypothetical protein [uncultured Umboniibacter sp.]|uniref:hypothetical protein n=1 Tax=uncultured Umboniibacter sp. TaxID=1798917 RepID=UPI0026073926|nr:hypothetical protein [uncultured Umboniibacter sp.]
MNNIPLTIKITNKQSGDVLVHELRELSESPHQQEFVVESMMGFCADPELMTKIRVGVVFQYSYRHDQFGEPMRMTMYIDSSDVDWVDDGSLLFNVLRLLEHGSHLNIERLENLSRASVFDIEQYRCRDSA